MAARKTTFARGLVVMTVVAVLASGCNSILGIHSPSDRSDSGTDTRPIGGSGGAGGAGGIAGSGGTGGTGGSGGAGGAGGIAGSGGAGGMVDAGCVPPACGGPLALGWHDDLGASDFHTADFLLGFRVSLTAAATLDRFGVIVRSDSVGKHVQFGLYRGTGAGPTSLVAQTNGTALVGGRNEITPTVASVALAPGDYWIMAVFDQMTFVSQDTSTSSTWSFISQPYGAALPATIGTSTVTSGQPNVNYYILVN